MTDETQEVDGVPRWVKAFVLIALVLVTLLVVVLVVGRGDHGPGRHVRAGDSGAAPAIGPQGHPPRTRAPAHA